MPASRKERGLPEEKPKAKKKSAASMRGNNGKGQASFLGMEHAYDKVYRAGDKPCTQCECKLGEPIPDECQCRCHEVARVVARFKL